MAQNKPGGAPDMGDLSDVSVMFCFLNTFL